MIKFMVFNVKSPAHRATLAYSHTQTGIIPRTDFTSLDSNLQNLPKELYVEKLLEITNSNEHYIVDYRTYLCSKAKSIQGCHMGNLTPRKTTKNNPSVIKYAKDCSALNMFCNGDDAYLGDVFDKSKNKTNELPKSSVVEQRSSI